MINQREGRCDISDRFALPDIELPEDHQGGDKWQGLVSSLTDHYTEYHRGMAKPEVTPPTVPPAIPSEPASQELVDLNDVQTELAIFSSQGDGPSRVPLESIDPTETRISNTAMSKTQYQLTAEEGKLWEKLTDPELEVEHGESPTETLLMSLREKSCFMAQSLVRRSTAPTGITYEESKNVLRAMGVPCIDSTGPYEAEALASSLVLNGLADYVASEDTVCRRTRKLLFCLPLTTAS